MNMGYCRFQNTLADLEDCFEHISDDLSKEEQKARIKLIRLCKEIVEYDDREEQEADELDEQ